ncbi:MAG: MFS transporter [Sulfobacillus sp.]|nr:MFS transporter [Sulfobacillus sp.]
MTQGIRPNLAQFLWLVANTVFVGLAVGMERTVIPLLGREVYHVGAVLTLSFIASFGLAKAPLNLVAGRWSDRVGRRPVLIGGWLLGIPAVLLLMVVHRWWGVILANVFLGANQAFSWTMTITAQLDLAGPRQRGLAMGINEATGYIGVAVATWLTGLVAHQVGLVQSPVWVGSFVVLAGLAISVGAVRDTRHWVAHEATRHAPSVPLRNHTPWQDFWWTSFRDPTLSTACWAGLTNKLADTVAWGALPLYLASQGLSVVHIAEIGSSYALVWGIGQFGTGILSDHVGRKRPIVSGFVFLGLGLFGLAWMPGLTARVVAASVGGLGMALLYPNLNSAVGDVAPPQRRGSVLGIYRLWRDGGYVVGGLLIGALVAAFGARSAVIVIAGLAWVMAGLFIARFHETHPANALSRVSSVG